MRMENFRQFEKSCEQGAGVQRSGNRSYVAMGARSEGCCILSRQRLLSRGQRITLSPDSLAGLCGRVQWTDDCLAGILFDKPLYGPVYEHLARTFPRLSPEPGTIMPRQNGTEGLSDETRRELLQKIMDVEAKNRPREGTEADRYNRMVRETPRGGLRSRPGGGRVFELFSDAG
jgi:hypothetical protein